MDNLFMVMFIIMFIGSIHAIFLFWLYYIDRRRQDKSLKRQIDEIFREVVLYE